MVRLRVLEPCDQSWDTMRRRDDTRARHCGACARDVHDLTQLEESEKNAYVLFRADASLCVRLRTPLAALALGALVTACAPAAPAPSASPPVVAAPRPSANAEAGTADGGAAAADEQDAGGKRGVIVVESMGMVIMPKIMFARGETAPSADATPVIDAIVGTMKTARIRKVRVDGHTSNDEAGGKRLADARAKEIVARLVARGVDASRLVARGVGSSQPVDDPRTAEGRASNRRIEFTILETDDDADAASCPAPAK